MFRGDLGSRQLQAGPSVVDGQWHHVTCQRKGNQIIETVDGETHSVTKATGSITVTEPVRIGSHGTGGDWGRGALGEVSSTTRQAPPPPPPVWGGSPRRTATSPPVDGWADVVWVVFQNKAYDNVIGSPNA